MLWVMAPNIPPKPFPLENTKDPLPAYHSSCPTLQKERHKISGTLKDEPVTAPKSSEANQLQVRRRARKSERKSFNSYKPTRQPVCRQPGSLLASREFPACRRRPFRQGKDPFFDASRSLCPGCGFPQVPAVACIPSPL